MTTHIHIVYHNDNSKLNYYCRANRPFFIMVCSEDRRKCRLILLSVLGHFKRFYVRMNNLEIIQSGFFHHYKLKQSSNPDSILFSQCDKFIPVTHNSTSISSVEKNKMTPLFFTTIVSESNHEEIRFEINAALRKTISL